MRFEWQWSLALAAAVALAAPVDGLAQGRHDDDDDRNPRARRIEERGHPAERIHAGRVDRRDDRDERRRSRVVRRGGIGDGRIVLIDRHGRRIVLDGDLVEHRERPRQGRGPAFCRSGAGHPVHGPAWCLDRGWSLGGRPLVFLDGHRVVFWNGRDAAWVRNVRVGGEWSLWSGLVNGLLEVTDFG